MANSQENMYPFAAFNFELQIAGDEVSGTYPLKEVSGIKVSLESGNEFQNLDSVSCTYAPLVLKRAMMSKDDSLLTKWAMNIFELITQNPEKFQKDQSKLPLNLQISLLDEKGQRPVSWMFYNAIPLDWELSTLDSMSSEVLYETLTLKYDYFKMTYA